MLKSIITILFLIYTTNLISQTTIVNYSKRMEINIVEDSINSDDDIKFLKFVKRINSSLENINFELIFNETESFFKVIKTMKKDNDRHSKLATNLGGSRGVFYINLDKKLVLNQVSGFGQSFLISSNLDDYEWRLTKEEKLINGKKTYKAILKKEADSISKKNTYAWFCPEISSNIGPVGYGNLPGLILELHLDNGFIFYANKITLNADEVKIEAPSKGKKVTKEEFEKIGKEAVNQIKKG